MVPQRGHQRIEYSVGSGGPPDGTPGVPEGLGQGFVGQGLLDAGRPLNVDDPPGHEDARQAIGVPGVDGVGW